MSPPRRRSRWSPRRSTGSSPASASCPACRSSTATLADIMRGEEVQLLGACALAAVECDGLVCHPGTHTKWVEMEGGAIARFRTVMTGDVFAALARQVDPVRPARPRRAGRRRFLAGVDHALANADLTAELFAARARVVLGRARRRPCRVLRLGAADRQRRPHRPRPAPRRRRAGARRAGADRALRRGADPRRTNRGRTRRRRGVHRRDDRDCGGPVSHLTTFHAHFAACPLDRDHPRRDARRGGRRSARR